MIPADTRSVALTTTPALPLWAATVVVAASGPVLDAAFPGLGWWPFAFLGIALHLIALIGRTAPQGFLLGFVGGLAFYFTHISWASLFLGLLPMVALSVLESLFWGLGAALIVLAYRWIGTVWPGPLGRLLLAPAVIASLWTLRDAVFSVWPYGGFAWGRVGLSQTEGPLAHLYAWVGISGVGFVMVLLVALAIEAVRLRTAEGYGALRLGVITAAAISAALVVPAVQIEITGTTRIAAVQGDGPAGYFDRRDRGDLLAAQFDATSPVLDENVDLVIWPEGATDIDPLRSAYAAAVFDLVTDRMDAPLIAGAITERDGKIFNTSLLWRAGQGAVDFYDKQHPVPFGEYVPDRAFWEPFAPDLIGLIQREYTPGTTDLVFDLGDLVVGVNICFDIADDRILIDSVKQGAGIIVAQTNNADFGRTDESAQQLAIARARALELGRTVVNISTVGTSAIIAPDGSTLDQLPTYEPGVMLETVSVSDTITPAVVASGPLALSISLFGLATLLVAAFARRGSRRGGNRG